MPKKIQDIKLTIKGITEENKKEKLIKTVEAVANYLEIDTLLKAKKLSIPFLGSDDYDEIKKDHPAYNQEWELMPRALKQHEMRYAKKQMKVLNRVVNGIIRFIRGDFKKAKEDEPFKISGKIIYSLRTGEALTEKEWNKVRDGISEYLRDFFVRNGYQLAEESAVISGMLDKLKMEGIDENKLDLDKIEHQNKFEDWLKDNGLKNEVYNEMYGNFQDTAQYCVNMSDQVKNDIVTVLQTGLREGKADWQLEQELREMAKDDGAWGKDWHRIGKTEISNIRTDMQLADSLNIAGDLPTYKIGAGHPNACKICKRDVIGKIVRVLSEKPKKRIDDDVTNEFIWPGKRSIGFGAKDPRTAISRHPHCGCWWNTYVPGMEEIFEES